MFKYGDIVDVYAVDRIFRGEVISGMYDSSPDSLRVRYRHGKTEFVSPHIVFHPLPLELTHKEQIEIYRKVVARRFANEEAFSD